ncbi:TetR/AcrR family transcriptional regulator [Enterococcus sp. 669A]|uniref:TetR/AcrR family transcriptional regulator n=1 Tax=Candidatus Enterococcus moelleringii TaxID=2815325 RepID=A0ABS3LEE5_9ENTE|nr:TetR/AcrR family transcriptional regulator [Enterococcus sp. 669A]MBO1307398.1 TetR/AcrR family transcriptional regulator [Enterococcus sp. 669A]
MARNKYPEITVDKILKAAEHLFIEKGYDDTTIQDIVNELNGLTKGAIYHHFKSKEDIMDALGDKMFFANNPFEIVKKRTDLNGLQKMRLAIMLNKADENQLELSKQSLPLLNNPQVLVRMIDSNRRILCPYWLELIEEGQKDGSIHTKYAEELAEFLSFIDVWFMLSVTGDSVEKMQSKYLFIFEILDKMGLPIYDQDLETSIKSLPFFAEAD